MDFGGINNPASETSNSSPMDVGCIENATTQSDSTRFSSSISPLIPPTKSIRVNFLSFGYKFGIPLDCDLVVDVRFLRNPYFEEILRDKDGTDKDVVSFVFETGEATEFVKRYADLLNFLIPKYIFEGKAYLNIGIGCTGGKHRSVAVAEKLCTSTDAKDCSVSVKHRDIHR